jgi:hypothetical protein
MDNGQGIRKIEKDSGNEKPRSKTQALMNPEKQFARPVVGVREALRLVLVHHNSASQTGRAFPRARVSPSQRNCVGV